MVEDYRADLEAGNHVANALVLEPNKKMFVDWSPYLGHDYTDVWDTTFPIERLKELGQTMRELPEGFVMQRQVAKVIDDRLKMQTGEMPLNWGAAETLAYATLLDDGYLVRLTGEDVGRGTFSHRHAKLHNQVRWFNLYSTYAISKRTNHVLQSTTLYCLKWQYWHLNTVMQRPFQRA